ncbi:MAG: hypothetical protein AAB626_02240 [Patescibacteria group bacterium]
MITNKIKLFLLLTFGFVFLFTQNSFAYTKWGDSPENNQFIKVTIPDDTSGYKPCATPSSATTAIGGLEWQDYKPDEFCLLDQTNINQKLIRTNDYNFNPLGIGINNIKIPFSIAENLWKTIESTGPSYPDGNEITGKKQNFGACGEESRTAGNSSCSKPTFISKTLLSPTFTVPEIYDNVKKEIIRSCLPGKIKTTISGINMSPCCKITKNTPITTVFNTNNYSSWSFPGCEKLSSSMGMIINKNAATENGGESVRIGAGQSLYLSWNLSNPSASCELRGFDANNADSTESTITKIVPSDVIIDVRSEAITPKTGQTTYTNTKMGIYTYTFSCAGTLDGKNFPPSDDDKPVVLKKKVLVGPIPAEPTITSFCIKPANYVPPTTGDICGGSGPGLPTIEICETYNPKTKCKNVPQIHQTDDFKLCWNATTADPKITITPSKGSPAGISQKNNPGVDILNTCNKIKLPLTDYPIGLWNYELEVENSEWTKKGLDSAIRNIIFDVIPIDPIIEKFEVLDEFGNATTSVLTSAKTRLRWKVLNTKDIEVRGNNFDGKDSAPSGATIVEGFSSTVNSKWLPIDENDLTSPYTYTLKAYELFDTNNPITTPPITLQRRQPGQPIISKFEFDKPSVTKKEAGGSGYVSLNWIAGDAKSITIEGPGVPFSATKRLPSGTIAISIDDLSVDSYGLKYNLTACPTIASNPTSCAKSEATLKVYSSDAFGATLVADDSIIRTGNSTKLRWDVASNDKIKSYFITSTSNDVNLTEIPGAEGYLRPSGEIEIKPTVKTTYTLNVLSVNAELMKDFSTSVTVGTTDKDSPLVEFSADKTEVNKGEAVVLTWNVQDTKEVSINNNIGLVAKQGSTTVYPEFTTLYILTAKSAQPGVIPNSEKTVQIKIIAPGFEGLEKSEKWENPTDLKTQYGLLEEAERLAKLGILDLKVNGVDGPITVKSPANFTLSWNLDKYCLATGSWLSVKTKAGTENVTLKKNGKYTYNLYCPGAGSDSVEITVTGGQGGLLDQLLGGNRNGDGSENGEGSGGPMPIAEIAVSTDKIVFSTDVRVIKGKEVELFIRADKDISGDGKASRDQNGEWGALLSNGGGCLYNTKLTKDLQFDGGVESPKSAQDCNASLGKFTFNDEPGTYQYGVFKLVQNDGKFSNIAYITVTVDGPPAINSAPTMDFRIDNKDDAEQTLGTPANYYLTWDVANANTCLATGSWNGAKPPQGIQNFLKSSKSSPVYTLTCENELGITAKTIALKIVESPICKFTALPPSINKLSSFITESELSWKCDYTDECNLSPIKTNGIIKTYGTMRVSPDQTTNYILTCTNSDISKSFEAKVEVK